MGPCRYLTVEMTLDWDYYFVSAESFFYLNHSVLLLILWYMTRARNPTWRRGGIVQPPSRASSFNKIHDKPPPSPAL